MKKLRLPLLLAAAVLLIPVSLCLGRYTVSLPQLFDALLHPSSGSRAAAVLWRIRLPRVAAACFTGAALAVSGAVFQLIFHNPMATPDLLGTTSGACFGASLAILLGISPSLIPGSAFAGGLLSVLLVMLLGLSSRKGDLKLTLILVGIVIGSLFTAATSSVKLLADPADRLPAITYWLMGSLSGVTPATLLTALIPALPAGVLLFALRSRLDLMNLSDEEIRSLGARPGWLRATALVCASLLTASAVSVSGQIGWVGLVIPNLIRVFTGGQCRRVLPVSALAGGCFLLIMDDLARTLLTVEIPIGILTAMIGAPCFMILYFRTGRARHDCN